MPLTPEQRAREKIDALLTAAGWIIQDTANFNRNAGAPGWAAWRPRTRANSSLDIGRHQFADA